MMGYVMNTEWQIDLEQPKQKLDVIPVKEIGGFDEFWTHRTLGREKG